MKIPLTFKLNYMQADKTEYLQRSVELEPLDQHVVIELEVDPKYVANVEYVEWWEAKKVYDITGEGKPKKFDPPSPVLLTPLGVAKVREMINEVFDVRQSEDYNDDDEVSDDDW